jgi:hypothetical protein
LKFYQENFCQQHHIADPCLLYVASHHEATLLFAMYAVFLALGHTPFCARLSRVPPFPIVSTALPLM